MSKFQIKLNSGLPGVKASVGAGATVTATIDNTAGFGSFSWSVAGTDETTDWEAVTASIVTSGARNETATFVVGGVGSATRIQAVADGGINQRTGAADPTLVATAKAFVPAANGAEVITVNETRESDATWAYTALVNNAIRATYGGGPVLSDANPQPLGTTSPGVAGTAMRGDAIIPHGDLAGGSLHALAVASVAGVGGSSGFASPAMAEAIAGLTGYTLRDGSRAFTAPIAGVDGTTPAHLATKGQLDAAMQGVDWQDSVLSFANTPPGSPATGARYVIGTSPTGAWVGKANQIAEWSGAAWVYTVPNKGFTTQDESSGTNYNYNGTAWVTMGSTIAHNTLSGLTTGDPHTQYTLRTDGSVIGNSNTWAIRDGNARVQCKGINNPGSTACDVIGAADVSIIAGSNPSNTTAGVAITARGGGIKLQVNDATTPATVRTPFEIVREAEGVGTPDRVYVNADFGVLGSGAWLNVKMASGRFTFDWTDDDNAMSAYWDHVNGFLFNGAPIRLNGSTATAGQIRVIDGEILNAKGSTGSEACLISYDKTLTSAVFGSDGAGTRPAVTSVLVGSTSAQLAVGGTAKLEARADQIKANTQLANGVNAVAASTSTTTIDCSKGNVHKVTVSAATTIALTNTKAGAQYRIYFELSGSTSYTVTLGAASFDGTYNPSSVAPGGLDTYPLTSSLAHGGLICEPFADGGKAFVTRQWTTP